MDRTASGLVEHICIALRMPMKIEEMVVVPVEGQEGGRVLVVVPEAGYLQVHEQRGKKPGPESPREMAVMTRVERLVNRLEAGSWSLGLLYPHPHQRRRVHSIPTCRTGLLLSRWHDYLASPPLPVDPSPFVQSLKIGWLQQLPSEQSQHIQIIRGGGPVWHFRWLQADLECLRPC